MASVNARSSDRQPKDFVFWLMVAVFIVFVMIVPLGMIMTGRGDAVLALLLMFLRLFLWALPILLLIGAVLALLKKAWKIALVLVILAVLAFILCQGALLLLAPITI